CIRANNGAVRVEQQLTGQTLLVPQSGDVSLTNGQLESMQTIAGRCTCEYTGHPAPPQTEFSKLATSEDLKKRLVEHKSVPPPPSPVVAPEKPEPVYQVFMPPLRYDASTKIQQEYDPDLIVLVRRVRVRPTLVLQGRVEGNSVVAHAVAPNTQA